MSWQADDGFFWRTWKKLGKHFYFSLLLSANVRTISGQHSDICPPNVLMMSSPCPHKLLLQNLLPHHQHHECINRPLIIFNHNSLLANPTCSRFSPCNFSVINAAYLCQYITWCLICWSAHRRASWSSSKLGLPSLQLRKNGLYRKNKFFLQQKYPKQLIDIVI